jgi:hypothetical protein
VTAVSGLIAFWADVLAQPQAKVYHIGYPNLRAGPAELMRHFSGDCAIWAMSSAASTRLSD